MRRSLSGPLLRVARFTGYRGFSQHRAGLFGNGYQLLAVIAICQLTEKIYNLL